MFLVHKIYSGKARFFVLATMMMGLVVSPSLFADPPPANGKLSFDTPNFQTAPPMSTEPTPASVFGNYAGAGKCPPGSPKPCIDTGAMDNVFIQPLVKPETDEDKQIREFVGQEKTDTRMSIRILRDNGHSCTIEGEMFWSGDHLEFQDRPPYGAKICKLQLLFKDGGMAIKDPGNVCSWKFCSFDKPMTLDGKRFQKGPDQLLAAYKKAVTPPPAAIFGTYNGTGGCATDERKPVYCYGKKSTDYVIVRPSKTADARVIFDDAYCGLDADAMWFGSHLAFVKEMSDRPGRPQFLQFWFKGDTLMVENIGNSHCAAGYFKKSPAPPSRDTTR